MKELDSHKIINWETGPWQSLMHLCHHFRDGKQMFRQCVQSHTDFSHAAFGHGMEHKKNRETCRLLTHPEWTVFTPGCTTVTAGHLERGLPQRQDRMMATYAALFWSCCSVTHSCPTLCDPMDCSMPGLPVLHHLPEFAQNPCPLRQWGHPVISSSVVPFSFCLQFFPASRFFSNESALCIR